MAWEDRAYNTGNVDRGGPRLIFPMPSILTLVLIVACVGVFIAQAATGNTAAGSPLLRWGALRFPSQSVITQPWRWITYQYLHEGAFHVFFNVIAIYFLVPIVERMWGWKRTIIFYTLGGIAAGITAMAMSMLLRMPMTLIGASGAILALLGAITAIAPDLQMLAMFVIPITMRTFTILVTILYVLSVAGDRDLSAAAHLGGLAFGFFTIYFLGRRLGLITASAFGEAPEFPSAYESVAKRKRESRNAIRKREKLKQDAADEQQKVDEILAKVSSQGMQSLSWMEKRTLKQATHQQRTRDRELRRLQSRR